VTLGRILSDGRERAELNEGHMGKTGATDLLSFPMPGPDAYPPHRGKATLVATTSGAAFVLPPGAGRVAADRDPAAAMFALPPGTPPHLGDIVVSVERAIEQVAPGRGGQTGDVRSDARDELRLLVTHGTLHVCGWDHAEPDEEAAMRALERELLRG